MSHPVHPAALLCSSSDGLVAALVAGDADATDTTTQAQGQVGEEGERGCLCTCPSGKFVRLDGVLPPPLQKKHHCWLDRIDSQSSHTSQNSTAVQQQ